MSLSLSKSDSKEAIEAPDLTIEAAGAHQGLVQDVGAVRGRDHHHALVALEALRPTLRAI